MDDLHFDRLARLLAAASSRRTIVGLVFGGLGEALLRGNVDSR
jgi:hypothetical protein